jgi:hypothetical protein
MVFTKSFLSVLILFFAGLNSFAQNQALKMIDTADLKHHLSFLSADSLQGRGFGTPQPGLDMAAGYLKVNIEKTGLASGADDYFQMFSIISSQPDIENTFLEVTDANGNVTFKTDSVIGLPAGSGINILNAEVIFAGFGWSDDKTGYNDLNGVDVRGKVVLFSMGTPESFKIKELSRWNNSLETVKIKKAKEAGAALVIVINNPLDEGNSIYNRMNRWINRNDFSLEMPDNKTDNNSFLFSTPSLADVLLGGKGKFKKSIAKISEKQQPHSYSLEGLRVKVKIDRKTEHVQAKNVIGIIEGSDPELKSECVVLMAHYDHLGIDAGGDVFNGADDNGSGTVALLEVAEAFANMEQKPKRSIVFLWVTAEEVGLLGSKYYVENPVFPVDKTVACINIDMAGRVFEQRDTVWNKSAKLVKNFDGLYTLTNNVWPGLKEINSAACNVLGLIPDYSLPSGFLQSSDHFSFHSRGVPVINYATGYHADYHKVTDEISRINFDKMKRVADLCFLVGNEIANCEKIELFKNEDKN